MLYRLFSSLKTSVIILSFVCLIFLIGTIFPQGKSIEDYINAGGRYIAIVSALDFLDIFVSPLFVFTTGILMINLAVCLYDRFKIFLKFKRKPKDFESLKKHQDVITFEKTDIEERLRNIGFRLKAESGDSEYPPVKIFEKGLQYWWLSWFYHVGIILAVFGFFLTALLAFEKDVVLYPGKAEKISLYSKETRWNKFLQDVGIGIPEEGREDEYVLTLREFRTEYYQGLKIDYPKGRLERLLLGLGVKKINPLKEGFSYMPKMWLTTLEVKKPDGEVLDAELWVNKPFRTAGLTLYQMGYEQKARLHVNGRDLNVEVRVPFQVEGIKGRFVLGSLKLGTLFKKDGTTEKITPVTTIYHIPDEKPFEREALGELGLGGNLSAKGADFRFSDYEEGSYLSYRKDPGVLLVGIACLFVFIGLFVRSFGAWYRVNYSFDNKTAYVLLSTRGILADKDRIIKKLRGRS